MSGGLIPWQASNALINGRYLQPLVYDGHLPPTPSGPIGVVQKSGSACGGLRHRERSERKSGSHPDTEPGRV